MNVITNVLYAVVVANNRRVRKPLSKISFAKENIIMADLIKCPICKKNVRWSSGAIVCVCGLSFRTSFSFDKTNKLWNNRPKNKEVAHYTSDNKHMPKFLNK